MLASIRMAAREDRRLRIAIIVIGLAIVVGLGVFFVPKIISDYYVNQGNSKGLFVRGAFADYDKAIQFNPQNARAYWCRGLLHGSFREWDQAVADFTSAITIDPKDANAYEGRGDANYHLGNTDAAYADFTRAIEADPNYSLPYLGRASLNEQSGRIQEAIQDYSTFLKVDQKDDSTDAFVRDRIKELNAHSP